MGDQRLHSLSDRFVGPHDETEVVRHFTLYPCGAGGISITFKNMAKYAKQQIRSNRIKRVTEGSYADLYQKEEEYERKNKQRMSELNRGAPHYNSRINW